MSSRNRDQGGALERACMVHQNMLLRHARNFLGPRHADAQDFVQDTMERFVTFFREGPPPDPRCAGWLMTTLSHLLISEWRKDKVRKGSILDPALPQMAAPRPVVELDSVRPPTPMERVMENITPEGYRAAVDSLSGKLRAVYELHVLGLSHAEIAGRLGITVVAARKRLYEARRRLAKLLQLGLNEETP